ncbi:MAG: Radical domain protein, partial [Bacteroidota bacterium]|nr:Radical domain protein [Bacteroidota bacterium]
MKSSPVPEKGRGAQNNLTNRYSKFNYDEKEYLEDEEGAASVQTKYIEVFPKTIVNPVKSQDIRAEYSMNPYEGCEHGCSYCYARNTHPYWGYNAGLDFERVILVKKNAPALLKQTISKKSWVPSPIMFSGNTDCYQPIERKLEITRNMLKVLLEHRHPVCTISKNSLIQRDIDILSEMASMNLAHCVMSITTLDEEIRRKMEPRTASAIKRLQTVEALTKAGIPVTVNIAPIIPGLTDTEIFAIAKQASEYGALGINYTILRLPGEVEAVFTDWVTRAFPMRKDKILNQTAAVHGGKLQDSQRGRRMRGEGNFADSIHQQMQLARNKYDLNKPIPELRCDLFDPKVNGQI